MNEKELNGWIQGCRRGDSVAQYELHRQLYGYAYHICIRYTSNDFEAEELVQDGFLKVFTKIDQYSGEQSFLAWFKVILIHTCIDRYRSRLSEAPKVGLEEAADLSRTPEYLVNAEAEHLLALLQQLSPAYRVCFNMYAIEGYGYQEIADMLGISIGSVKSNISKARTQLKAMIGQDQKAYHNGK